MWVKILAFRPQHPKWDQNLQFPVRKFTARHGKNPAWFWPESLFRGENGTGQSETRNLSRFATRTRHLSCYCPSGNLARFERDRARLNLSLLKSYVKLNETFVWLYYERECGQNQRDKDKEKFVDYISGLSASRTKMSGLTKSYSSLTLAWISEKRNKSPTSNVFCLRSQTLN